MYHYMKPEYIWKRRDGEDACAQQGEALLQYGLQTGLAIYAQLEDG